MDEKRPCFETEWQYPGTEPKPCLDTDDRKGCTYLEEDDSFCWEVCPKGGECEALVEWRQREIDDAKIPRLEKALADRDRLIGELLTGGIGAVEVDSDYRYWLDEKWTEWDEMKEAGE